MRTSWNQDLAQLRKSSTNTVGWNLKLNLVVLRLRNEVEHIKRCLVRFLHDRATRTQAYHGRVESRLVEEDNGAGPFAYGRSWISQPPRHLARSADLSSVILFLVQRRHDGPVGFTASSSIAFASTATASPSATSRASLASGDST